MAIHFKVGCIYKTFGLKGAEKVKNIWWHSKINKGYKCLMKGQN